MPCYPHHPIGRRTRLCPKGHVASRAVQVESTSTVESCEARWPTGCTSWAGPARDCRRSDAPAAVMQVRPLSVSSGTAGWNPFGGSAVATSGWL